MHKAARAIMKGGGECLFFVLVFLHYKAVSKLTISSDCGAWSDPVTGLLVCVPVKKRIIPSFLRSYSQTQVLVMSDNGEH